MHIHLSDQILLAEKALWELCTFFLPSGFMKDFVAQ